jgi:periplasmic protein TonB
MTQHLTWDEISDYLIGGTGTPVHAGECGSCRAEVARFESALAEFRGAVRNWSDVNWSNRAQRSRSALGSQVVVTTIPSRGMYSGNEMKAGMTSLLINAAVVALLLIGTVKPVQVKLTEIIPLIAPDLRPLKPKPEIAKGGGGSPQNLEAAKGKLPKSAPRQFAPPLQPVDQPKLPMTPTIVAPDLPNLNAQSFGDPLGKLGIPSAGNGLGTGIGIGKGPGVGPGSGGSFGGGAFKVGGGVSAPVLVFKPEPEYSEEARKAKWQGGVTLQIVVDEMGVPKDVRVTKSLGMGLDQKAMEAVMKWRFKPGMKDGKAVPVIATVEVNFRLL